ncbi:MAG: phosphoribosylglycinamide formyltransferase [Alphaproteobacteria bacterium]|nr:phosphoribosylglycinamide formyltransferase [Alphaproteobacteria bacterium]
MRKLKLGVQISGRGSNLQALIDACADKNFPAEIVLVISNIASVEGLAKAKAASIPTQTIPHKSFATREAFEVALDEAHTKAGVELICNAGFMRIISPYLINKWRGRMINIHPSLLPSFPGLHTHARALEAGVLFAGCTVHYVEEEVDAGAMILQAAVPILPNDTEASLAARVLTYEHKAYPAAVCMIAQGVVSYKDGKIVRNAAESAPQNGLLNPALLS